LKKIAEKLVPERDADKKRLLEITDRQFEVIIILMFLCGIGLFKPLLAGRQNLNILQSYKSF